ncbi:RagB/SusD family nutrient uptake outer membrane protein [Chitinophaga tropicalis]|uniref:RagB/SusD family nutrient uptake outer membrane protein n=1 Tax=Chitinophaga tropicalis TaxID=2683588 RepID=A0A7K1U2G1_9BACT|nr:RagB/SusD family nutrient uptake outer membrane protein [Chitinophaga tropicalis]MVT08466.1 RagB/SusD family nutrient uptake outer membrane protein [Chitinophaga tropicalis]
MRTRFFFIILVLPLLLTACLKEISPSDSLTTGTITKTTEGLKNALNGAYALFKDHVEFNGNTDANNMYLRQYFQMSDFAGDDIVCGQTTTDPLYYSFSLNHTPTQTNSRYFWYISYKIINDVNTVIEAAESIENPDATVKQLIGECYFLRAFCHFNLLRFYARPYTQAPAGNGIILRTSTSDPSQKARATVTEAYNAVIADAEKGASLMQQQRGVQYASQEAAWALLSRVYLYKENNDSTVYYSDKVINSGRFGIETAAGYRSLFANAMGSKETILCVAFTTVDDYGKGGSIASMIYSDGNSGWGEEFASQSLRDTMSAHPEDVRWSYIIPLKDSDGNIQKKNGIEIYYISKFSFQGGSPTLSSPVMFRLSEMYLNKAEAEAKAGNVTAALNDVDMIRKNRGLESALYNGQVPAGSSILDVVLKERRIELAFEGHRTFDVYRNERSMDRTYWGYHLPGLKESDIDLSRKPSGYQNMVIAPDNNRIIYYIPIDEIQTNKLCQQNP